MNIPFIPTALDPKSKGLIYPVTMAACTVAAVFQSNHNMLLAESPFMFLVKFIWYSLLIGIFDIGISIGVWVRFGKHKEEASVIAGIIAIPLMVFAWLAFTKNNILPETCLNIFWAITAALHALFFITFTEELVEDSAEKKERSPFASEMINK